ncbi:16071_t:CDS:2, partial [Cetraspora pellucida]
IKNKYEDQYAPPPDQEASSSSSSTWWVNESNYLNLAKYARDCLPIPATSVPSEQIFSISGEMITEKRNRLDGKT